MKIVPSDPDFPFEMDVLDCNLQVPAQYPKDVPSIRVLNKDMPRGFAINVEKGFDRLAASKSLTLLDLMKSLDKNLEVFLSERKAETITLVTNADKRHVQNVPVRALELQGVPKPASTPTPVKAVPAEPVFTADQRAVAAERRKAEIRQLEARLGRLPLYNKSGDGIAYTLPLEPRKRSDLSGAVQAIKTFKLFVPTLYPLQPCRVQLEVQTSDATRNIEREFANRAEQERSTNLMGHINYLAQNMHVMAKVVEAKVPEPAPEQPTAQHKFIEHEKEDLNSNNLEVEDKERSHIVHIPRPPEWTVIDSSDVEDSSDDYSYDSGDESGPGGVDVDSEEPLGPSPAHVAEKGTALSFPFLELYGIELLEVVVLNITIKCERCKDTMDVNNLKNLTSRTETCKKCASPLTVGFRRELLHSNNIRAGFLDLDGCTIVDMLPSRFIPTCSECSTSYPLPGIVSVRGETTSTNCRECHQKLSFKLPETKFLRITTSHLPPSGPRRKPKESLGLVAGTELPKRGRCKHYAKSYRWFRFSCCAKVYACDRCHDESEEHPNEHANRMICGWCSREQNYRPEDCGVCHGVVVGKKGSGFWEGGKGTRDRTRMSRKDKRKHRRIGGPAK